MTSSYGKPYAVPDNRSAWLLMPEPVILEDYEILSIGMLVNLRICRYCDRISGPGHYVLYSSRLRVNENGIWITETLTSQRGSSVCQP